MVPAGSQLSGALRVTVVARRTTVPPSLAIPPAAEAMLRVTRLPFMTRRPWLARPPPVAAEFPDTVLPMTVALACGALTSPPPNPEAEFPDSTLFRTVSTPVPGTPPGEGRLPMPPPAPGLPWLSLGAVLPVTRLPAIVIVPWCAWRSGGCGGTFEVEVSLRPVLEGGCQCRIGECRPR